MNVQPRQRFGAKSAPYRLSGHRMAHEQKIIPQPTTLDVLFDETMRSLEL